MVDLRSKLLRRGAVGGTYAILLLLAFVPGPRLYLRQDFRYLRGDWYVVRPQYPIAGRRSSLFSDSRGTYALPGSLSPDAIDGPSQRSQLASALWRSSTFRGFGIERPRCKALEAYCDRYANDVIGWAHLCRFATGSCQPSSNVARVRPEAVATWQRGRMLELKASEAGMKLDPNNAYFRLIHAGAMMASGDHAAAYREVLDAARAGVYRDYSGGQSSSIESAIEDQSDALGSVVKLQLRFQEGLPHLAFISGLFKQLRIDYPGNGIELRRAAALVANEMMCSHESMLVATAGALLLRSALPDGGDPDQSAAALDASEGGGLFVASQSRAERVRKELLARTFPTYDFDAMTAWTPRLSAACLAMMLLSFPAGFLFARTGTRAPAKGAGIVRWHNSAVLGALGFTLVFAGFLAVSSRMPCPELPAYIVVGVGVAWALRRMFLPPGTLDPVKVGAAAVALCGLLYVCAVVGDVRMDNKAAEVMQTTDALEQAVLNAAQ